MLPHPPAARFPDPDLMAYSVSGGFGAFGYCSSAQHKENGAEGNKAKQSERYLVYGAGCFTHAPNYFKFYFKHAMQCCMLSGPHAKQV